MKSNFGRMPDPFGFRISENGDLVVCEAPEPPRVAKASRKVDRAEKFLRDVLDGEELKAGTLVERGQEEGFSESTLRRAADQLGVKQEDGRWKLPSLN